MAGVWKGEGFDPEEVLAELAATPYIPLDQKVEGLTPEARAAGEWIVERNLEAVRAALDGARFDEPPCALCLLPGPPEAIEAEEVRRGTELTVELSVGTVTVLTPSERERVAAAFDREIGPWIGIEYPAQFDLEIRTPQFWAREDLIALEEEALHGDAPPPEQDTDAAQIDWVFWPWGWIYGRIARDLNERPPFPAVTEDFVAFYQGQEFDPNPRELVPLLASPTALTSLRSEGLLEPPLP